MHASFPFARAPLRGRVRVATPPATPLPKEMVARCRGRGNGNLSGGRTSRRRRGQPRQAAAGGPWPSTARPPARPGEANPASMLIGVVVAVAAEPEDACPDCRDGVGLNFVGIVRDDRWGARGEAQIERQVADEE